MILQMRAHVLHSVDAVCVVDSCESFCLYRRFGPHLRPRHSGLIEEYRIINRIFILIAASKARRIPPPAGTYRDPCHDDESHRILSRRALTCTPLSSSVVHLTNKIIHNGDSPRLVSVTALPISIPVQTSYHSHGNLLVPRQWRRHLITESGIAYADCHECASY
jgi:hypothetical protein